MQTEIATNRAQTGRLTPTQASLAKFVAIGAVAYVINQAVLFLLYDLLPVLPAKETSVDFGLFTEPDISLLIASAIAVQVSIAFKYFALQHYAFPDRQRKGHPIVRFLQFNGSSLASSAVIVLTINILTPALGISPYIATTLGTLLGFAVNWGFSHYIIWPHHNEVAPGPAAS
jgi:putative flippase GtrA